MSTAADDPAFDDLFDALLQQLIDGETPDLDQLRAAHPAAAGRVEEALAMAGAVTGRRQPTAPSFGGYEILRELGHGGMGTVYLARHETLGREIALKVLPQSFGLSPRSRRRFLEEARALARLQHDHIVRVHRVLDQTDLLAFEMEFVDGPSLRQLLDHLRAAGPAPGLDAAADLLGVPAAQLGARNLVEFFVRMGVQMARALDAAHQAGIVHRDVKPGNLLLRRDGKPLLADFGLARGLEPGITQSGAFVGTPTYASPEQLRGGDEGVDARADVYSLGVTLYEAIALMPPFSGRSTTDMLRGIEEGRIAPLRRHAPQVPRDLETILLKAMERLPKDRYATAGAFADDLERLLHLQPILARPVGPLRRAAKFLRRKRSTLVAAVAGALLVALAMLPWLEHLQAAQSRRAESARLLTQARQELLAIGQRDNGWHQFALARGPALHRVATADASTEVLDRAAAGYQQAAAIGELEPAARVEQQVVQLAIWLRTATLASQEQVARALDGAEFRALAAPLPPLCVRAARQLAAGQPLDDLQGDLPAATASDRMAVGLLCFVLREYRFCERCWNDLDADTAAFPLLDAGLGMLYLADGRPDRAYVRLFHGTRSFPESTELQLVLADAALAIDDPVLARQWLLRSGSATAAATPTQQRLRADLAAAEGDVTTARAVYRQLAAAMPDDPLPRYRLAEYAEDDRQAQALLAELLRDWPEVARFRLDAARVALQLDDAAGYLAQACYVVQSHFGVDRSAGASADLLEILHRGGLDRLYREGVARNGGDPRPRRAFDRRGDLQRLLPAAVAGHIEELLTIAAGIADDFAAARAVGRGKLVLAAASCVAVVRGAPGALAPLPPAWRLGLCWTPPLLAGPPGDQVEIWFHAAMSRWLPELWGEPNMLPLCRGDADPEVMFGTGLDRAGDVDGDGVDDFLVGSTPMQPGDSQGKVELVSGRSGDVLQTLRGGDPGRMFGFAVANLGDADGDGSGDWLVGAPSGTSDPAVTGAVELFGGKDHRLLLTVVGDGPSFGLAVAGIGDWNGDGRTDFAVGSSPNLRNSAARGSVQVHSGGDGALLQTLPSDRPGVWFGAALANVGDVDGDGFPDLAVGGNFGDAPGLVRVFAGRSGAVLHTWFDESTTTRFGESVHGLGDLDGDGRAEVAVAAPGDLDHAAGGRVLVFAGASGRLLHTVSAEGRGDRFGQSLCRGPDLDGDGVADWFASAEHGGMANSGFVLLVSGRTGKAAPMLANTRPSSSFANRMVLAGTGAPAGEHWLGIVNSDRHGHGSLLALRLSPAPLNTHGNGATVGGRRR